MKWFRFYAEVLHDPKVQRLSPQTFKHWVNLLCLAAANEGIIDADLSNLAFSLRVSEGIAATIISGLIADGLIEKIGNGLKPHNWDERQFVSDQSYDRVKKYREKLRDNGSNTGSADKHRSAVYSRDGHACLYCGSTERLCLDHIVPVSRGGSCTMVNLATSCKRCNSGKSGRTPKEAGYRGIDAHAEAVLSQAVTYFEKHVTVTVTPSESDTEQIQNREEPPLPPKGGVMDEGFALQASPPRSRKERHVDPVLLEWFESEFWPKYPRKVGKQDALKWCMKNAAKASDRENIMGGVDAWMETFAGREIDLVPHATTFLNRRDWDEGSWPTSRPSKATMTAVERMIAGL
jgi:hypothetical protein